MQNMILATPVLSDQAALSTSTSPASLPGSNLQNRAIKQVWRSLDPMNAYIEIDLRAPETFNLIALLGHSGSSRSFARIRTADDPADLTTSPAYDSGNLPLRSHQAGYDALWASGVADEEYGALETNHFLKLLTAQERRYIRIDISDPERDWLDVGRLYVANAWQPATNMDYGLQEGIIDPSTLGLTKAGRVSPNELPKRRVAGFTLSFNTEAEMRDSAFDIEWERGSTRDVLFIPDPDAGPYLQKRTVYGRLTGLSPIVSAAFSIFEKQFRIEEITA